MTREAHDMQAEIDDLRRRLAGLEAREQSLPKEPKSGPRMLARGRLATAVCALGLLGGAGLLYGQDAAKALALFIDPAGRVGIGTATPRADLDVAGTLNVSGAAALAGVNVRETLGVQGNATVGNLEVKGALAGRGDTVLANAAIANASINSASIGSATLKGPVAATGPVTIGHLPNAVSLDVAGVLRAEVVEATSPMRHRMYPSDALIYQDIFDARDRGVVAKLGNPDHDDTSFKVNPLAGRRIIKYGGNVEPDGNGAKVTVPPGYDTLWVRVLGDRWSAFQVRYIDGAGEDMGLWTGGNRPPNTMAPDGGVADGSDAAHQWVAIPVKRPGQLSLVVKPATDNRFWLSGVAFSRNPWAHAAQAGVGYHWRVNGGDALTFDAPNLAAKADAGTNSELKVPVVPSGRDKLLFAVVVDVPGVGATHSGITVNGQSIERFVTTYDNPFARHWNSKLHHRYLAARIPAALIPGDARFLNVRIDMRNQSVTFFAREIGTHDLDVPWTRPPPVAAAAR